MVPEQTLFTVIGGRRKVGGGGSMEGARADGGGERGAVEGGAREGVARGGKGGN
jgi:hypothetical protein